LDAASAVSCLADVDGSLRHADASRRPPSTRRQDHSSRRSIERVLSASRGVKLRRIQPCTHGTARGRPTPRGDKLQRSAFRRAVATRARSPGESFAFALLLAAAQDGPVPYRSQEDAACDGLRRLHTGLVGLGASVGLVSSAATRELPPTRRLTSASFATVPGALALRVEHATMDDVVRARGIGSAHAGQVFLTSRGHPAHVLRRSRQTGLPG
jgi:hypothetical protein